MAYNKELAERIQLILQDVPGIEEKKMFGGVGFILQGNMAVGVHKDALMIRVSPGTSDDLLSRPHTRLMDMTGKPMRGWILVEPAGYAQAGSLQELVAMGLAYARSLPAK